MLPHDRSFFFTTHQYWQAVEDFFQKELQNDGRDLTSALFFSKEDRALALVSAKQSGILAGRKEAQFLMQTFFPSLSITWSIADGAMFKSGDFILRIEGSACDILKCERVLLNTFSRMSGVATQTKHYTQKSTTALAATRKTQWSYLDKKAVSIGGGLTHRMGLFDAILIKENHAIAFGKGEKKMVSAFEHALSVVSDDIAFLEAEVETPSEFLELFQVASEKNAALPVVIMFDNFSPTDITYCLERIPSQRHRHARNIFLEISGGITQDNLAVYDALGADVISIGALTHSVLPIDFSLRMQEL